MPDQVTTVIICLLYMFFCLNFAEFCLIIWKTRGYFNIMFPIFTPIVLDVTVLVLVIDVSSGSVVPIIITSLQKLETDVS